MRPEPGVGGLISSKVRIAVQRAVGLVSLG